MQEARRSQLQSFVPIASHLIFFTSITYLMNHFSQTLNCCLNLWYLLHRNNINTKTGTSVWLLFDPLKPILVFYPVINLSPWFQHHIQPWNHFQTKLLNWINNPFCNSLLQNGNSLSHGYQTFIQHRTFVHWTTLENPIPTINTSSANHL